MLKKINQKLTPKQREVVLYIFFGGLTTLVSIAVFSLCSYVFLLSVVISNVVSWIISVAFAYLTNRTWVFGSKKTGAKNIALEVSSFCASRMLSGLIETAILYIMVDLLYQNKMLIKVIATVIVVVVNYILSKLIVFRTKKNKH